MTASTAKPSERLRLLRARRASAPDHSVDALKVNFHKRGWRGHDFDRQFGGAARPFAPLAIFPVGPKFRERQPTRLADAFGVDSDSVGPLRMATATLLIAFGCRGRLGQQELQPSRLPSEPRTIGCEAIQLSLRRINNLRCESSKRDLG